MNEHKKVHPASTTSLSVSAQSPIHTYKDRDFRAFIRNSRDRRKDSIMISKQEQAIQIIEKLSDDDLIVLIDFMKRFVISDDMKTDSSDFWPEMESMRMQTKHYFPEHMDSEKIWEEAINEKYGDKVKCSAVITASNDG